MDPSLSFQQQMGGLQAPQDPSQDLEGFPSAMPSFEDNLEGMILEPNLSASKYLKIPGTTMGNSYHQNHPDQRNSQQTPGPVFRAQPFKPEKPFEIEDFQALWERDQNIFGPDPDFDESFGDPEQSQFFYPEPPEPQHPSACYHKNSNAGSGMSANSVSDDQEQYRATFDPSQSQHAGFYHNFQNHQASYHDTNDAGSAIAASTWAQEEEQHPAAFDDLQYHYASQENMAYDSDPSSNSELLEVDASNGLRDQDRFLIIQEGELADPSPEIGVDDGWNASLLSIEVGDEIVQNQSEFMGFDSNIAPEAAVSPSRAMASGFTAPLSPFASCPTSSPDNGPYGTEQHCNSLLPGLEASPPKYTFAGKRNIPRQLQHPSPEEVTQQSGHESPYNLQPSRPVNESFDDYVQYRKQRELCKQRSTISSQEVRAPSSRATKHNGPLIQTVKDGKKRKRTPVQERRYVENDEFGEEEPEILEETDANYSHQEHGNQYYADQYAHNYHPGIVDPRTYNANQVSGYQYAYPGSRFSHPSPNLSNTTSDSVYFDDQLQAKRRKTAGGHVQAPVSYPSARSSKTSTDMGSDLSAYTKRARFVKGDCTETGFGGERKWWFRKTNTNGLEVRRNRDDQWRKHYMVFLTQRIFAEHRQGKQSAMMTSAVTFYRLLAIVASMVSRCFTLRRGPAN